MNFKTLKSQTIEMVNNIDQSRIRKGKKAQLKRLIHLLSFLHAPLSSGGNGNSKSAAKSQIPNKRGKMTSTKSCFIFKGYFSLFFPNPSQFRDKVQKDTRLVCFHFLTLQRDCNIYRLITRQTIQTQK